ncbi:MAG: hypothetical protein PVH08_10550, partial [Syntrophobacterales bacterium]|jgi:hypothetical protein
MGHGAWGGNFELRNWEPARRVGVCRTIANLKAKTPIRNFVALRREPCALRLFFLATGYLSVNDFNGFNDLNDLNGCLLTP